MSLNKNIMIHFENVTKQIRDIKILDDINLQIDAQDFVSLIGPSGAGKTTLINALLGEEKVTSGKIRVDDHIVTSMKPRHVQKYRQKVGMVFQDCHLLPTKTVYENVAFGLEACGKRNKEIREIVPQLLRLVDLEDKAHLFPHQLSGGEKQRTAIARALIHDPKLIVADEPTGNLDPDATREIIDLLQAINKQGATILLATHNKGVVDLVKRRVVNMKDGRIISDKKHSGYSA